VEVEAVLFDVGNTLLRVPHDPQRRAIGAVVHLGEIPFTSYKASLQRAREEWRAAGGAPESQDLPQTWIGHIQRALKLIDFQGDAVLAARLIEDSFLLDGWEVYADAQAVLEELRQREFAWVSCPIGRRLWSPRLRRPDCGGILRQLFVRAS
jgi:FMN phosphatase YigB (HAD superfamily)